MSRKTKGPGFANIMAENVETRQYRATGSDGRATKASIIITCPFCAAPVKAYIWSLCGGGKRCPCGALFGPRGNAYHFKKEEC